MILPFDVNQQTVSRSAVTSIPRKGSREYLYLSFTFSDDWTDLTKTLYVSSETYSDGIIIEEGVPVQVPTYYTQQNSFSITLCGIKGNEFVPTNIVTVLLEESNDTWEEIAPDPESIPYQQLIAMVQKAIESMHAPYINEETKTCMDWSIEQNMVGDTGIVAKGEKGDQGDKCENGSDANVTQANVLAAIGYTPFDKSKIKTEYQYGDILPADEVFSTSAMPIYLGKQHYESTDNRVNTIDEEADNASYPTALAVWKLFNSIVNGDEVRY